ncbi:hypothetical protein WJX72_005923 [[Myrmecia] bisecta]|uniref:FHA domain-containing protein n=1 Tax=[Myrmecia] bisecta TaxID=41462 RepID=A0AAW1R6R1_9CHLO
MSVLSSTATMSLAAKGCTPFTRPRCRPSLATRAPLRVVSETVWQLAPRTPKHESASPGKYIELVSPKICHKSTFTLSTTGPSQAKSEFPISGVHVEFECRDPPVGARGPDAVDELYIKDVDSKVNLLIDGKELEKGRQYKLRTGALLQFGQDGTFQVQRDMRCHA